MTLTELDFIDAVKPSIHTQLVDILFPIFQKEIDDHNTMLLDQSKADTSNNFMGHYEFIFAVSYTHIKMTVEFIHNNVVAGYWSTEVPMETINISMRNKSIINALENRA